MFVQKIASGVTAAAIVAFISVGPTQAAMSPGVHYGSSNEHHGRYIHHVDCAVGFHLGSLGTCVVGTDNPPPPPPRDRVIIEHRSADEGCQTKSVKREDVEGNSETRTKTNCD